MANKEIIPEVETIRAIKRDIEQLRQELEDLKTRVDNGFSAIKDNFRITDEREKTFVEA